MTDRRQAGAVIILRETARGARKALEVPEKGGNHRVLAENDGSGMLIRVHHIYMPHFSSFFHLPGERRKSFRSAPDNLRPNAISCYRCRFALQ